MNREATLRLIAFMEDEEKQKGFTFRMTSILIDSSTCGTAGCLVGEWVGLSRPTAWATPLACDIDLAWDYARTSLGLSELQADLLFEPWNAYEEDDWGEPIYVFDQSPWSSLFAGAGEVMGASRAQGIQALKRALEMWGEEPKESQE